MCILPSLFENIVALGKDCKIDEDETWLCDLDIEVVVVENNGNEVDEGVTEEDTLLLAKFPLKQQENRISKLIIISTDAIVLIAPSKLRSCKDYLPFVQRSHRCMET